MIKDFSVKIKKSFMIPPCKFYDKSHIVLTVIA